MGFEVILIKQTRTIGSWSISIAPIFETKRNQDSWQAYSGDRVVYISAMSISDQNGKPMSAQSLSLIAKKKLTNSNVSIIDFEKSGLFGYAVIINNGNGYQLKGFVCALGSIATCFIDFKIPEDEAWAKDTWESLCRQ